MKSTFRTMDQQFLKSNQGGWTAKSLMLFVVLVVAVFFACSCKKQASEQVISNEVPLVGVDARNVLTQYPGLALQTSWELQQARASTARYRQIANAIRDGYADIDVVTQGMGHHYMKASLVDNKFDFKNPEILVYNKNQDGSFELVAVEYAIPINLMPNTAPEGFTGNDDVWDKNTLFGLWLLHAWIWAENPLGVFNPTNPLIHTH